jgi:hypothetical protein
MSELEVIDGTSTELEPYEPTPLTLYGTRDPRIALERMHELADALMDVVRAQHLRELAGGPADMLTRVGGEMLIEKLQGELAARMPETD